MIILSRMGQPCYYLLNGFLRWRLKSSGLSHGFDDTWANPRDLKSPESNPGTVKRKQAIKALIEQRQSLRLGDTRPYGASPGKAKPNSFVSFISTHFWATVT
jgi:hypothetical protein